MLYTHIHDTIPLSPLTIIRALSFKEAEAEETRERALRDVERARDQALQDITAQASRMVIETSSRVIQSSLNEQDHQRLIEESLAEFSASDQ